MDLDIEQLLHATNAREKLCHKILYTDKVHMHLLILIQQYMINFI